MKTLLMLIFGCFMSFFSTAQVQLLDLTIMPVIQSTVSDTDSVHVLIQFKINNPTNVQNINFSFGSQPDYDDIFSGNAQVIQQGADYFTNYNGRLEKIQNHDTRVYCKLSMGQYVDWQHLSVFASYTGGGNSNHLYQTR